MDIAISVLDTFNSRIPNKAKPREGEWTTIAGIVAQDGDSSVNTVLSVASGVKAVANKTLESQTHPGCIIHDSHAEILAIRAFNRYLLEAVYRIENGKGNETDNMLLKKKQTTTTHYEMSSSIKLSMYISHVPCGDASMELTMASQSDPTPWINNNNNHHSKVIIRGRDYFDQLGRVRTKPGRRDSPCTLSKSCSDKLMIRQYLSLLNSLTSLLIKPVYLDTLVLQSDNMDPLKRAFHSRLTDIHPSPPYEYRPFDIQLIPPPPSPTGKPCNISAVWWYASSSQSEALVNGIKMGAGKSQLPIGSSSISRRQQFTLFNNISCTNLCYKQVKKSNTCRVFTKQSIIYNLVCGEWQPTAPDDDFFLVTS